ncbi:MAG: hypothetical protein RR140_03625 [Clostridia bacterium]
MENEKNREQPLSDQTVQGADAQIEEGTLDESSGSLGKFKDAESLLYAYNNLQAEFTRKCQKLSELEKLPNTEQAQKQNVFETQNWSQQVLEFIEKNQNAKEFAGEISNVIMQDDVLKTNPNALELAWAKIVQEKFKQPNKILEDKTFVENEILSNPEIQEKVIEKYLKELYLKRTPHSFGRFDGVSIASPSIVVPNSLSEAKNMALKFFGE